MNQTKYRVNEMFRSVQAEGKNAGSPAVFVRFAGCNLSCQFCDTAHEPYVEMSAEEIDEKIEQLSHGCKDVLVVFTGGEPTLQLKEEEPLASGHPTAVETNGILPAPKWIGWVTVSPKSKLPLEKLKAANEIKVLYGMFDEDWLTKLEQLHPLLYIQPLERCGKMNTKECVQFLDKHPQWKLSVQWHKIIGVR